MCRKDLGSKAEKCDATSSLGQSVLMLTGILNADRKHREHVFAFEKGNERNPILENTYLPHL